MMVHRVQRQAEQDDLGMAEGLREANGEREAGSVGVASDLDDVPAEFGNVGEHLLIGIHASVPCLPNV